MISRTGTKTVHGRMRCIAFALATLAIPLLAHASVLTADLGAGLEYIRLPDASVIAKHEGAQVVDLRFTGAVEESAEGLAGRLRAATESGATLIVLVNAATDPLLRRELAHVQGMARPLVFIGPVTPELAPEIVTAPDPEQERRACDAIAAGTPPAGLIKEVLDKPRFDEAHLARNRTNGTSETRADGAGASPADPEPKPNPLKDVSLQRAVFLHRALIALGRVQPVA